MPAIDLKIEQLVLDNENPRITHAASQHEAMQKVVKDQKTKLVRLAESIVERGLSPIERLMVLQVSEKPKRYIALEGNRRVTVLKLLTNPAVMTGLEIQESVQRALERLASIFEKNKVEPISGFEVGSRDEARYWIELRHNGEDQGRGVVGWKPIVAARFRKREPAVQALDLVLEHGGFTPVEAEEISSRFSLTTLRRLIESEDVRPLLGLTVRDGRLHTTLPGSEVIKPLKRIVRDIADKEVNSRSFNKTEQMVKYVQGFERPDIPDFTKKSASRPIEAIQKSEFKITTTRRKNRRPDSSDRRQVVPKNCSLNVTENRIAEIYKELRTIKLADAPNAIAVLLRVFLEMSVDHFLENNGGAVDFKTPNGQSKFKKLDKKLAEVVSMLVSAGVPKAHFASVTRSVSVVTSPMNIDLFHRYVHDRFATPSTTDLKAAWDHAQPLFEKIWP
ncbi:MAG: hypothetical protein KIS81_08230 [Maricaulaceae bacterium]|nr:hypothetical protein [Maricaulaceae bacterium]